MKKKKKKKKKKYSYALVKGQGEYGCRNYSTQHRRQYEFLDKRLKNYHIAILIQNFLFIIRSQYLGLLDRGEEVILEKLKIFLTFVNVKEKMAVEITQLSRGGNMIF